MKLTDLLKPAYIKLGCKATSKEDALKQAVALMETTGAVKDSSAYEKGVFDREKESTTGVGDGVAIPHAKGDFVSHPALVALTFPDGVEFDSLDGQPAKVMFLIAAPESHGQDNDELAVLSRLSKLLMDETFVDELLKTKSSEEFLAVVSGAERHRLDEEAEAKAEQANASGYPEVLAVTSCPNGIAHTYMAEEGLENAAKKLGVRIKVETDGTAGVGNPLTPEEIKASKGIIVAADASVEMSRFKGKPLISVSVSKGISKAEDLIKAVLDGKAPVYGGDDDSDSETVTAEFGKETVWHKIYKYLMGGVGHMIPFVIAGGILIALAFLIDFAAGTQPGPNFGSTNQVAAWFKTLGGYSMAFMLPVLAGFIAFAIAGAPALVVGFVGGYLATTNQFSIGYTIAQALNNQEMLSQLSATSGFLGAIAAGFMAGYIIVLLKLCFKWMPKSVEGLKSMLVFPLLGVLLIGIGMYILNTPLQYVSIGFSALLSILQQNQLTVLICIIVAAMMAVDMGGPVNKAAYVFGSAVCLADAVANPANAESDYMVMAAVMVGGMVPPIAIALAADLFPVKWSKKERQDSKVNYILGLSFITEGAIPYAASYPLPVIGSSVIGAAVSGLITGLFKVRLMAPHGGIFVFAVVSSTVGSGNGATSPIGILWYLIALIAGSLVGALCLGCFMKDNPNPEIGKFKGIFHINSGIKKQAASK